MPDAQQQARSLAPGPPIRLVRPPAPRAVPARLPKTVSVVIPSRGGWERIRGQLAALAGQDFPGPFDVIVSNNDGDPRLTEVVEQWARHNNQLRSWRVVDSSSRPGVSGARNIGCTVAAGELLLVCDDDDVVADNWVSSLVARSREAHVLGGRLLPWSPRGRASDVRLRPAGLSGGMTSVGGVPLASGSNCAVWREAFLELGGWSESYQAGGDDADFSIRAQLAGFAILYVPEACVHYAVRPGLRAACRQQFYYGVGGARIHNNFAEMLRIEQPDPRIRHLLGQVMRTLGYLRPPVRAGFWLTRVSLTYGYFVEARRLARQARQPG